MALAAVEQGVDQPRCAAAMSMTDASGPTPACSISEMQSSGDGSNQPSSASALAQ